MARTGSVRRAFPCAWLALLLSGALFAMLLAPAPRWQGAAQRTIAVSLLAGGQPSASDPSQKSEPGAPLEADPTTGVIDEGTAAVAGIDGYLPASLLTERPQVVRDIDPEWRLPGIALPVLACTLLINEYGDVDQVLPEGVSLSPTLEQEVRTRFMAARFSPGKLHGRPVRTALRIEIRLD